MREGERISRISTGLSFDYRFFFNEIDGLIKPKSVTDCMFFDCICIDQLFSDSSVVAHRMFLFYWSCFKKKNPDFINLNQ